MYVEAEHPQGYLVKAKARPKMTRKQQAAMFVQRGEFLKENNWEESILDNEVEAGERAALAEIGACGYLTSESGTHAVENFYDMFGWVGGTTDNDFHLGFRNEDAQSRAERSYARLIAPRPYTPPRFTRIETDLRELGLIPPALIARYTDVPEPPQHREWPTSGQVGAKSPPLTPEEYRKADAEAWLSRTKHWKWHSPA